ncbi:MAG: hypothetical protein U0840_30385 [Gemmataceae bacterium]
MSRVVRVSLLALLVGVATGLTATPDTPERPPQFAMVKGIEGKKAVTFIYWSPEPKTVVMQRQVDVDGKKVTQVYQSMQVEWFPMEVTIPLARFTAESVGGKTVKSSAAWRGQIGKAVVILPQMATLDPVYKAQLTSGTVVVTLKENLPKGKPVMPPGVVPATPAGTPKKADPSPPEKK